MEGQILQLLPLLLTAGAERAPAEASLTQELLPRHPREVLQAFVSVASQRDIAEPLRIQSLVLFRRLAFKPLSSGALDNSGGPASTPKEAWDELSRQAQAGIQNALLELMSAAGDPGRMREAERHQVADTVAEVDRRCQARGYPWDGLAAALLQAGSAPAFGIRESAFRVYASDPAVLDEPFSTPSAISTFLLAGLSDSGSPLVRAAAMDAAVAFVKHTEGLSASGVTESVVRAMVGVLPPLVTERKEERLEKALQALVDMASTPRGARACAPIWSELVHFIAGFISSPEASGGFGKDVRQLAVELLVAIPENASSVVASQGVQAFCSIVLPVLLSMMAELDDDPAWYKVEEAGNSGDDDDENYVVAESALDRLSSALGHSDASSADFLRTTFSLVTPLAASEVWQNRHAALSAVGALAEGSVEQLLGEVRSLVGMVESGMNDPHPRVKYAAVYAVAQLCTSLEGVLQKDYSERILTSLTSVMASREPRLQAFSAAALINFADGASAQPDDLKPFLQPLLQRLLGLLEGGLRFVQEAAVGALAHIIDVSESAAAPFYPTLMPILFTILETPLDEQYNDLICKTLHCASLLAAAAGPDVFAPDSDRLAKDIITARSGVTDDADPRPAAVTIAFTNLARAMGPDRFLPYLDFLLPLLLEGASLKPDVSVSAQLDGDHEYEEGSGWETIEFDGQTFGIRTTVLQEKATAVEMLVILCDTMGPHMARHYQQIIDIVLPLLKFYFSEDVRDAAACLLPVILKGAKAAKAGEASLGAVVTRFCDAVTDALACEANLLFISTLISTWASCFEFAPAALPQGSLSRFLNVAGVVLGQLGAREQLRNTPHGRAAATADDELDVEEAEEPDANTFVSLSRALRLVMLQQGQSFDLTPWKGWVQTWVREGAPCSIAARKWALRILGGMVKALGPASVSEVAPLVGDILQAVRSPAYEVRAVAAFIIGLCAEHAADPFVQLINASVDSLLAGFDRANGSEAARISRENCVSAIAKIVRNRVEAVSIDAEAVFPRWVDALPIELDTDEIEPTYGLLLELIARGHASVAPSQPELAAHVANALATPLGNRSLLPAVRGPLAIGLRSYLSQMPEGQRNTIWNSLNESVRSAVQGDQ